MVIQRYVTLTFAKKDIIFCWMHSHVGTMGNEKADSAAKSTLEFHLAKIGYPIMILNIKLIIIFCPLDKMIRMVQLRTSFNLTRLSCDIGRPPTGGAGRMTVCHSLVECNHFCLRK